MLIAILALAAALIYIPMLLRPGGGEDRVAAAADPGEEPIGRAGPTDRDPPEVEDTPLKETAPPPARPGTSVFDGLFGSSPEKGADRGDEPKVTSIIRIGNERMAVIDGKVRRTGDRIKGRRVAEIREAEVLLRAKDAIITVPLAPGARPGPDGKKGPGDPAGEES